MCALVSHDILLNRRLRIELHLSSKRLMPCFCKKIKSHDLKIEGESYLGTHDSSL